MADVPTTEQASTNFFWTFGNKEVFNLQTTVRGGFTAEEFGQHLATVKDVLAAVLSVGGHAKSVGKQDAPIVTTAATVGNAPTNGAPPLVEKAAPANGQASGEQSFQAESLVGSILEGKPSWKVKGGRFTQFGVTIWPEALAESGFKVQDGKTYSLEGYTAVYVSKPDGKPQKVVKLTK